MTTVKLTKEQTNILAAIADATKKNENYFVPKDNNVKALIEANFIEVNTSIIQDDKAASRATAAGIEFSVKKAKPVKNESTGSTPSQFAMIGGIELPASKRGAKAGGAPAKYPFDQLEIGISFFVGNSEVASGEAAKSMQSSVAAANSKYSEGTGEFEMVERTKRGKGNKAELDAAGNKIKETVQVEKKRPIRKFVIRPVEGGKKYGDWTAPESGAIIQRVAV